jgi:hypothetical protein
VLQGEHLSAELASAHLCNTAEPFACPAQNVDGFCTGYCGYHSFAAYNGVNIKLSFVGNPGRSDMCRGPLQHVTHYHVGRHAYALSQV